MAGLPPGYRLNVVFLGALSLRVARVHLTSAPTIRRSSRRVSQSSEMTASDVEVQAGVVVIDTEQETEHMERLGQVLLSREQYVGLVRQLRDQHAMPPTERRSVDRLVRSSER